MSFCVVFSILFLSVTNSCVYGAGYNKVIVENMDITMISNVQYINLSNVQSDRTVNVNLKSYDNTSLSSQTSSDGVYDVYIADLSYVDDRTNTGFRTKESTPVNTLYINGVSHRISTSVNLRIEGKISTISYGKSYTVTVKGDPTRSYVYGGTEKLGGKLRITVTQVRTATDALIDEVQKGNELQKENNDLQKEQNETSKGILGKITEFFASFFENLKGLFVPEDGYFSDFFTRLNDFFSEKLGMLYAPIDMFITFLNTIKDASSTESGITFPELAWDGTVIIPETKFSFSTITKDFPDLQEKIYFVTDVILVGAVLWLLQVKLKEVLEN